MFFDPKTIAPSAHPTHRDGEFNGLIVDVVTKPNRNGTGQLLMIKYSTKEGKITQFISYEHTNKKFEKTELEKLGKICNYLSLPYLEEAKDLIGKSLFISIITSSNVQGKSFQEVKVLGKGANNGPTRETLSDYFD